MAKQIPPLRYGMTTRAGIDNESGDDNKSGDDRKDEQQQGASKESGDLVMSKTLGNNDEVDATEPVLYSDEEMVTVANFPDPVTANIARSALESAGIRVFLQGEQANSLLPVAFEARVQVRPEDEARARQVLTDFEADPESLESVTRAEVADEAGTATGGGFERL